jgi:hypothetical protein
VVRAPRGPKEALAHAFVNDVARPIGIWRDTETIDI